MARAVRPCCVQCFLLLYLLIDGVAWFLLWHGVIGRCFALQVYDQLRASRSRLSKQVSERNRDLLSLEQRLHEREQVESQPSGHSY